MDKVKKAKIDFRRILHRLLELPEPSWTIEELEQVFTDISGTALENFGKADTLFVSPSWFSNIEKGLVPTMDKGARSQEPRRKNGRPKRNKN